MLSGAKVGLRAIEKDDLPRLWEMRNDAEIESVAGGPPRPRSMADMEAWLERVTADRDAQVFAIDVGGRLVGTCNLRDIDPVNRRAELGISLLNEEIGKGYGSDAIRVLLDYAFRHLNLHKVFLDTLSTNEPGLRAYRACGFLEEGRLRQHEWFDGRYVDLIIMGVLRDEWLAAADRGEAAGQDTLR